MAKGKRGGKRSSISYTEDELKQSILNYAKSDFTKIRSDQMTGTYNRDAEILEDYISKKSDDRTLYRGIKMSYADVNSIDVGDIINQNGISIKSNTIIPIGTDLRIVSVFNF